MTTINTKSNNQPEASDLSMSAGSLFRCRRCNGSGKQIVNGWFEGYLITCGRCLGTGKENRENMH